MRNELMKSDDDEDEHEHSFIQEGSEPTINDSYEDQEYAAMLRNSQKDAWATDRAIMDLFVTVK